jgi:hypothetical protein
LSIADHLHQARSLEYVGWGSRVEVRSVLQIAIVALGLVAGCQGRPSRVSAPSWDPDGFADAILTKLDANKDASVDMKEVVVSPGLAWGARYIDTDKNQQLSREELVARFTLYQEMKLGIKTKQLQLSYNGRLLPGAKVTLVPEFFLEGLVEPATGESYSEGIVDPIIQGEEIPGLRVGYYRVVVESPNVKIPAKYSSAESTPLGVEVSPISDDPRSYGTIQLALRD